MAITLVKLPDVPTNHPNLAFMDHDRASDRALRWNGQPVEIYRFTGDGATTSKTDVVTGFDKVLGGVVFNTTDGVAWTEIGVALSSTNPQAVNLSSIPADTDTYLLVVWGDKIVSESQAAINDIAPTVPTGLAVTSDTTTTITFGWNASTHPHISTIGYQYRIDGGSAVDVGAVLTATATGLTTGTEYDIEVRAYVTDDAGNVEYSAWSPVVAETTD